MLSTILISNFELKTTQKGKIVQSKQATKKKASNLENLSRRWVTIHKYVKFCIKQHTFMLYGNTIKHNLGNYAS